MSLFESARKKQIDDQNLITKGQLISEQIGPVYWPP